jgi:hypothetical protein
MSVTTRRTLRCDFSGCKEKVEGSETYNYMQHSMSETGQQIRERSPGWARRPRGKDYCPRHSGREPRLHED